MSTRTRTSKIKLPSRQAAPTRRIRPPRLKEKSRFDHDSNCDLVRTVREGSRPLKRMRRVLQLGRVRLQSTSRSTLLLSSAQWLRPRNPAVTAKEKRCVTTSRTREDGEYTYDQTCEHYLFPCLCRLCISSCFWDTRIPSTVNIWSRVSHSCDPKHAAP